MRRGEGNGPHEDDWLAEEDWVDAPTQETPPSVSRGRIRRPPPGTPSRRLVALVAGVSIVLLVILVVVLQGDGDEAEDPTPTVTQTQTATGPGSEAPQSLRLQEGGTLSEGDTGPRVRRLQRALAQLDYDVSPDGAFGPATTAAVREFQTAADLAADGVVGAGTVRAINDALAEGG